tara:strand:- start:375 stop:788 length:414 start_codon:yes stop_codon:yes gene_type:complete
MITTIFKLKNFAFIMDTLLIITTIIFTLTNFNLKNFMIFIVIYNLIQYLYFSYLRQENRNIISIGIPIGKVVYSEAWEIKAINFTSRSRSNNNQLFKIHLRYLIEMNFELHTKNLCNSNEHLNRLVNLEPVIGIPVN